MVGKPQIVMAALKKELRDSDALSQSVATAAEEHIARIWDPECVQIQVGNVTIALNQAKDKLILSATVYMECMGRKSQVTFTERALMVLEDCETEEEIIQKNRLVLQFLKKELIAKIPRTMPQSVEEYLGKNAAGSFPGLDAMVKKIAAQEDVLALLNKQNELFRITYVAKLKNESCPPGFQPVKIVSFRLQCSADSRIGKCMLQIGLECGAYFALQEEYVLGICPYYLNEERKRAFLKMHILECVRNFEKQLDKLPQLYIAPSLQAIPDMAECLVTLLQQGEVSLGHVTVKRKGNCCGKAPLLYMRQQNETSVRIGSSGTEVSKCQEVPLRLNTLKQLEISLERYTTPPKELAGLCRLGEALEKALIQTYQDKGVPAPKMVLQLNKKTNVILHCGSSCIALSETERAAGQKLMQFVVQSVEVETVRSAERQQLLEVLNSLNPTELAVLRQITANGETWYTALANEIEDQVCTTKTYTGTCLQRLMELAVEVNGKVQPLLMARWASSRKHDDFRMYRAGAQIDRDVLASATGRPFTASEAADMKASERGNWFTRYLLEADGEQRRTRFNEVLDHMPRTFLTAFVKSEEGQALLKGFTGPEAMFVRLTVEGLPGCKRLAAKLWPDGAENEDE